MSLTWCTCPLCQPLAKQKLCAIPQHLQTSKSQLLGQEHIGIETKGNKHMKGIAQKLNRA